MLDYLKEVLRQPLAPVAIVGLALVVYGSIAKTRWGINFRPPKACPRCGEAIARVRRPRSMQQVMRGGWTCSSCGAEIDKWGREAAPQQAPTTPD
jgi:hypothetical protein